MKILSQNTKKIKEVILTDGKPSLEEFMAVVRYGAKLSFSDEMVATINKSRALIEKFLHEGKIIYGVTTGFGENVRYTISPDDAEALQRNIVRSHACAVGKPLEREPVRAIMLMMIINSAKGHAGIRIETLNLIKDMLNKDLIPFAPGEGSVGYLGVEAHFAMAFMGEGKIYKDGKKVNAAEVLKENGLTPVTFQCKEGLSLLNGTITVTALGLLALYDAEITMKNIEIAGALTYEALRGTIKALDPRIHNAKAHKEQQLSAQNLLKMLDGSEISEKYIDNKVQDAYALRAMPHIHGAARKLIKEAHEVIVNEMHSTSDNPEVFPDGDYGAALMCGNFDGSYVGSHADMISMSSAIVANLVERLIDRMVNRNLNDGLPAFLVSNPGLNNGFMIPQYTAAGLVGEIKVLAHPSTIDSISTCANQEDPVSLAYFASKKAIDSIGKLQYLVAIQIFTALQAMDFLKPLKPSPTLGKLSAFIREKVPFVDEDRFLYDDIEYLKELVFDETFIELIENEIGELSF